MKGILIGQKWDLNLKILTKSQIEITKKIKRSVSILSKIHYFVSIDILKNLYYSLIYPFLIYGIIAWGNTYRTTINPLYILQKKAVCIMSFSNFGEYSSPLFKLLNIVKLCDLVRFHTSVFV